VLARRRKVERLIGSVEHGGSFVLSRPYLIRDLRVDLRQRLAFVGAHAWARLCA
jgi:hypothetical protein